MTSSEQLRGAGLYSAGCQSIMVWGCVKIGRWWTYLNDPHQS
jgi:hypothetical protein